MFVVEFVRGHLMGATHQRLQEGRRSHDDVDALMPFAAALSSVTADVRENITCRSSMAGDNKTRAVPCNVFNYRKFADKYMGMFQDAQRVLVAPDGAAENAPSLPQAPVSEHAESALRFGNHSLIPSAMPNFDNTARYPQGGESLTIADGSTAALFGDWMEKTILSAMSAPQVVDVLAHPSRDNRERPDSCLRRRPRRRRTFHHRCRRLHVRCYMACPHAPAPLPPPSQPSRQRLVTPARGIPSAQDVATPSFVAINAVNEWGEGCHLEPDRRNGISYYRALRDAKARVVASVV